MRQYGYQPVVKTVGDYGFSFNQFLGKGSFSNVYLGQDNRDKSQVAVKVIESKTLQDKYVYDLLMQEINAMKKLNHKHIVKLIEVYFTKNNAYLILEYCNQGDVEKLLQHHKKIPEVLCKKILQEVYLGYIEMLNNNIMHRDLKLANIFIKDGVYKLGDLGFAKQLSSISEEISSKLVGTPIYMSPQLLQLQKYNVKNDMWSLGVMYYEMLFGVTPWNAYTPQELVQNIQNQPLNFPQNIQISKESIDFIKKALTFDENQRISWQDLKNHDIIKNHEKTELPIVQEQNSWNMQLKLSKQNEQIELQNQEQMRKMQLEKELQEKMLRKLSEMSSKEESLSSLRYQDNNYYKQDILEQQQFKHEQTQNEMFRKYSDQSRHEQTQNEIIRKISDRKDQIEESKKSIQVDQAKYHQHYIKENFLSNSIQHNSSRDFANSFTQKDDLLDKVDSILLLSKSQVPSVDSKTDNSYYFNKYTKLNQSNDYSKQDSFQKSYSIDLNQNNNSFNKKLPTIKDVQQKVTFIFNLIEFLDNLKGLMYGRLPVLTSKKYAISQIYFQKLNYLILTNQFLEINTLSVATQSQLEYYQKKNNSQKESETIKKTILQINQLKSKIQDQRQFHQKQLKDNKKFMVLIKLDIFLKLVIDDDDLDEQYFYAELINQLIQFIRELNHICKLNMVSNLIFKDEEQESIWFLTNLVKYLKIVQQQLKVFNLEQLYQDMIDNIDFDKLLIKRKPTIQFKDYCNIRSEIFDMEI